MKNLKQALTILIVIVQAQFCFGQQGANKTLSNLNSPTSINQSLLPLFDNTKDLGSLDKSWKNIYLDDDIFLNGDIFIAGERFISNGLDNNVFVGSSAGTHLGWGSDNTMLGSHAGSLLSSGYENIFAGSYAGFHNDEGYQNTFVGTTAGYYNSLGYRNTFVGRVAGYANTEGSNNTFIGEASGYKNIGDQSGFNGNDNTFIGARAGYNNLSGYYNTFVGSNAGISSLEDNNSFFGYYAGSSNSTGNENTLMGALSGFHLTTGTENTFIGQNAGYTLATGSNVTCIGDFARVGVSTVGNASAFGSDAIVSSSNSVRIGSSSVASIGGYAGWSNFSDGRYKKNVTEDVAGLEFIGKLRPVTYTLDITGVNKFYGSDEEGDSQNAIKQKAVTDKEQIVYTGFIAQEVEKAAKEIGYDFSGVDAPKHEKDLYGLRYAEFVVPLVKAVQELSAENSELKKQIDKLNEVVFNTTSTDGAIELKTANSEQQTLLGQNIPNPFDNSTLIPFRIPKDCTDASIVISDLNGRIVTAIPIKCNETYITIDAGELTSGTYTYSLFVDENMISTLQMVLTR